MTALSGGGDRDIRTGYGYLHSLRYGCDLGALVTVTPSTDEPVTLDEAKLWLKIEPEEVDEDPLISSLIARARERYEAFTGRSLMKQTYDWYLDRFPQDAMKPPRWPLVSIGSIRAFSSTENSDTGGTTMPASDYYVDTASEPGRVLPVTASVWPVATRWINVGIVRFTAGYSTSSASVPEGAKTQVKKMIAAGYEHRGDEGAAVEQSMDAVLRSDELDLPDWG